jgi:DNA-binding response OmpR family regulator
VPNDTLRKILITDNDDEVLIALERILENEGYATETAVSYEEASKMLSQSSFDLLVLDDFLSDSDSIQFLTDIPSSRRPLVIVTYNRYPARTEQAQLLTLGVRAFIHKRAHSELTHIVHYLLEPQPGKHDGEWDSIT